MSARRFVKAGACFDEEDGFVHCALEHDRCSDREFVSSRSIEEKPIDHIARVCLEPHKVQSIYGGRCSNQGQESFCTGDASACESGNFVYSRECTLLASYLDGDYDTSVYGTCEGFCAFSEKECPGEWKPATGSEGIGDCTCLRVRTGACIQDGIPYCAVSENSCGSDETYAHVRELDSTYGTTCFLCSNPFNPFALWPTPNIGVSPQKAPISFDSLIRPVSLAIPSPVALDTSAPTITKVTTNTSDYRGKDISEHSPNLVGLKIFLSVSVISVFLVAYCLRWCRLRRQRNTGALSDRNQNLHDYGIENETRGVSKVMEKTRDQLGVAWEHRHHFFEQFHDRVPRRGTTSEQGAKPHTPQQAPCFEKNKSTSAMPKEHSETKPDPGSDARALDPAPENPQLRDIGLYDRDLLYEVAIEECLSRVTELAEATETSSPLADDHFIEFDQALNRSLAIMQDEMRVPQKESFRDVIATGCDFGTEDGLINDLSVTRFHDEDTSVGLDDSESSPIVLIQENGSILF